MGSRGNVFIRRGARTEAFLTRWIGECAPWLARGPEVFEASVREKFTRCEDGFLHDDVYSEGGVAVDADARRLCFYFAAENGFEVLPLCWRFAAVVRDAWPGWEVVWASRGLIEVMEFVQWDLGSLGEAFFRRSGGALDELLPVAVEDASGVVSIRHAARLVHLPVSFDPAYSDPDGTRVSEWVVANIGQAVERLDLSDVEWGMLQGGAVIDLDTKSVGFWSENPLEDSWLRSRWEGWRYQWWGTRYEAHHEAVGDSLRFPEVSEAEMEAALREIVESDRSLLAAPVAPRLDPEGHRTAIVTLNADGEIIAVEEVDPEVHLWTWVDLDPDRR